MPCPCRHCSRSHARAGTGTVAFVSCHARTVLFRAVLVPAQLAWPIWPPIGARRCVCRGDLTGLALMTPSCAFFHHRSTAPPSAVGCSRVEPRRLVFFDHVSFRGTAPTVSTPLLLFNKVGPAASTRLREDQYKRIDRSPGARRFPLIVRPFRSSQPLCSTSTAGGWDQ
jgi:hypothetical protein